MAKQLNFRPTWNRVLIEKEEPDEKIGMFYIPDVSKPVPCVARVIAVGPGYYDDAGNFVATTVKPGDRVFINRWAGYQVAMNGKKLIWLYEFRDNRTDIWGLVEEGVHVTTPMPKSKRVDREYQNIG